MKLKCCMTFKVQYEIQGYDRLSPKIAVPMRTHVAPDLIAYAISCVIPIDSVSRGVSKYGLILSKSDLTDKNAFSGLSLDGMAISPRKHNRGQFCVIDCARLRASSGVQPLLLGSLSIFT